MKFIDVGEDPDLVEVDDFHDASARDPLALPRVDIDHHAVERGAHQGQLALDLGFVELGFEDRDA